MSFVIGVLAGLFGGFLGVGGGIFMIPLLLHNYKLLQREAHGTSLCALVLTGAAGAVAYAFRGTVDYIAAVLLASTAILTARFGALCCHRMEEWKLKRAFGVLLFFVLATLLMKPYIVPVSVPASGWTKILVLLGTGGVTGFLSGLLGIGGGVVMIPGMILLAGMSQIMAQGSSLLCMVPVGMVGAYTHWQLGDIRRRSFQAFFQGSFWGLGRWKRGAVPSGIRAEDLICNRYFLDRDPLYRRESAGNDSFT